MKWTEDHDLTLCWELSSAPGAFQASQKDGTTTELVINGIIRKSYIHKVTFTSLLKILETSFKIGCT